MELTFAARGVISIAMSFPSSSFLGLAVTTAAQAVADTEKLRTDCFHTLLRGVLWPINRVESALSSDVDTGWMPLTDCSLLWRPLATCRQVLKQLLRTRIWGDFAETSPCLASDEIRLASTSEGIFKDYRIIMVVMAKVWGNRQVCHDIASEISDLLRTTTSTALIRFFNCSWGSAWAQ